MDRHSESFDRAQDKLGEESFEVNAVLIQNELARGL